MTIDYARAYSKELLARADTRRLMRQAIQGRKASHLISHSLRGRVGRRLIRLGERLLGGHNLVSQHVAGVENSHQ